jgi:hypothetical protein
MVYEAPSLLTVPMISISFVPSAVGVTGFPSIFGSPTEMFVRI